MTDQPKPAEQAPGRAAMYRAILGGINAGELPAPKRIEFRDGNYVTIVVDTVADLDLWASYFDSGFYRVGQPYPDLADPANSAQWLTRAWKHWGGWHLSLDSDDPITDEQRQSWIDSGRAAEFAARKVEQAPEGGAGNE